MKIAEIKEMEDQLDALIEMKEGLQEIECEDESLDDAIDFTIATLLNRMWNNGAYELT